MNVPVVDGWHEGGGVGGEDGSGCHAADVDAILGKLEVFGCGTQALCFVARDATPRREGPSAAVAEVTDTLVAVTVERAGWAAAFGLELARALVRFRQRAAAAVGPVAPAALGVHHALAAAELGAVLVASESRDLNATVEDLRLHKRHRTAHTRATMVRKASNASGAAAMGFTARSGRPGPAVA